MLLSCKGRYNTVVGIQVRTCLEQSHTAAHSSAAHTRPNHNMGQADVGTWGKLMLACYGNCCVRSLPGGLWSARLKREVVDDAYRRE